MHKNFLEDFCKTCDFEQENQNEKTESFSNDVKEILDKIIKDVIETIGKPVPLMQKEDKLRVVKKIEDKGAFLIKGSISQVAQEINVSRFTVYNYLDELKSIKKTI